MRPSAIASGSQLPCLASTDGLSARERFGYWHDVVARNLLDLDFGLVNDTVFEGVFSGINVGALNLSKVKASAHRVIRSEGSIRRCSNDHIVFNFVTSGRMQAEQDGRTTVIRAGEAVACDARRPYALRFDGPIEIANVSVPRQSLAHSVAGLQRVTAVNLHSDGGLCSLAFDFVDRLIESAASLSDSSAQRLSNSFIELIGAIFIDLTQSSAIPLSDYRYLALLRIKEFVGGHLSDFELNPSMVATALKLSPRYINQLLEQENTSLSRYIWRRRLERASADLRNSALDSLSISSIAMNNGFSDLSHFSKSFRNSFELSPSQYRRGR